MSDVGNVCSFHLLQFCDNRLTMLCLTVTVAVENLVSARKNKSIFS